jgi:hypothetical protein
MAHDSEGAPEVPVVTFASSRTALPVSMTA